MPRPRSTRTSPDWVPGVNSSSVSPSSVGTATRAPSAAWVIVRSTVEKMSLPSRTKVGCGSTWTATYTSPERAPTEPAWPPPEIRICWPSWMPAGISTSIVRSSIVRPAPSQRGQGCSTIRPVPPQRGQFWVRMNSPNALREICWMRPAPWQTSHVRRPGAGLDAVAVAHRARHAEMHRHLALRAAGRGLEVDLDVDEHVLAAPPPRSRSGAAEDVLAEEGREQVGEAAEVERRGREPAAPQARVPEAVVELAALGIREHLVRLDDLLEARLRVGLLRDVGVQLAGEPAERLLDLSLVGARGRRRGSRSSRARSSPSRQA